MNPFALSSTCVTIHKSENISFRGRQNFSAENKHPLENVVSYKVGVALSQKFDRSSQISVKTEQSSTKDFLVPFEKFLFVACFNVLSVSHLINVLIAPSLYAPGDSNY
jgi:hypothetical protein